MRQQGRSRGAAANMLGNGSPRTFRHDRAAENASRATTDIAGLMRDIGRRAQGRPRACSRLRPRRRRTRRSPRWRRRSARARPTSSPPTRRMSPKPRRPAPPPAFLDRLALDDKRVAAMADGLDVVRALPDPVGTRDGALDAAERHDHRARARAARRRRHHLRKPAERDRRCRRAVPQGRQCRDPARRLGELSAPTRAIHAALVAGPARGRPARGRNPARADARPRRGRADARGPRRHRST